MGITPFLVWAGHAEVPAYIWVLVFLLTLAYIPVALYTDYTLRGVFTTLALVENPAPAAYEVVSGEEANAGALGDDYDDDNNDGGDNAGMRAIPTQPITASLRRTHRLLVATSGWRGNFRGLGMAAILVVATNVVGGLVGLIPFVPSLLAHLLVSLALVQLSTAWVHTVLRTGTSSSPRPSSLRASLPPFRRTMLVAGGPVAVSWLASVITSKTCSGLAHLLRLAELFYGSPPEGYEENRGAAAAAFASVVWRMLLIGFVWLVLASALVLPAYMVQIRVQASLLPAEADTIVPFDRSFGGAVEPEIVGGRGYATMRDALRTFTPASWRRLIVLYVKTTAASVAAHTTYLAVVAPILFFSARKTGPDAPA